MVGNPIKSTGTLLFPDFFFNMAIAFAPNFPTFLCLML